MDFRLNETQEFLKEAETTQGFITRSLMKLAPIILEEAGRLQIEIPEGNYNQINFPGVLSGELLEYDIDDENIDQQEKNIVKIASEFLNIVKSIDYLGIYEECSMEEIKKMVPEKVNEVEIRRFEMLVHNLQSSFDSYVIHGGYRYGNRQLKQLRGHFSVVFHLLQIILFHPFAFGIVSFGINNTSGVSIHPRYDAIVIIRVRGGIRTL